MIDIKFELAILIPHYNNLTGLIKSMEKISAGASAIAIIVDDGSNKELQPLAKHFESMPNGFLNTKIIYLSENKGIEYALNVGLDFIVTNLKVEFIARLDCGDIPTYDRFDLQTEFLRLNPEIYLCGSWAEVINSNGKFLYLLKTPESHDDIKKMMPVRIAFVHPSIMFRTSALSSVGYYPQGFTTAEDYAFLFRFISKYKTYNLQKVLLYKERTNQSISTKKRTTQIFTRIKVILSFSKLSPRMIMGIIRTFMLLIIPYSLMEYAKEKVLK